MEEHAMTTLTRWNPFREMEEMLDRFGRPVPRRSLMQREGGQETMTIADWAPAVDIAETDIEYQIKVELPEVRKEDVKVAVNLGVLTIQGERKAELEEKNRKYHRIERSYGTFVRSFTLPEGVNEDDVRARFKDGMLHVHVAKSEKAKPKSIEVKID
jgi:HSP20 family protein